MTRIRWPARRNAAFDDRANTQSIAHLVVANRSALELEGGAARHDPQSWQLGQRADDVFGDAIGEELAVVVPIGVHEGQHHD